MSATTEQGDMTMNSSSDFDMINDSEEFEHSSRLKEDYENGFHSVCATGRCPSCP